MIGTINERSPIRISAGSGSQCSLIAIMFNNESKDLKEYDWKKDKRKKGENAQYDILCFINFHQDCKIREVLVMLKDGKKKLP